MYNTKEFVYYIVNLNNSKLIQVPYKTREEAKAAAFLMEFPTEIVLWQVD